MKNVTAGLLAVLGAATFAGSAQAQIPNVTPFSFEVRGGVAVPTGDFKDIGLNTGLTYGANATFHAMPMVGIYGAYSRSEFGADDDRAAASGDGKFTIDGFSGGVRVGIPTPLIPIDPWVKAGAVYHRATASEFTTASFNGETDRELGFEVGVGVGLGLGPKVSVTPGVSYTQFNVNDTNFGHFRADVGLNIRL